MYKISRYWNRIAFKIMRVGYKMIWDQTGMNADLLKFEYNDVQDILTKVD